MSKWKPIKTAPKDGTTIIGWTKDWGEPMLIQWVCIQQWNDPKDVFGWAEESDWSTSVTPTHWMPLPKPPAE